MHKYYLLQVLGYSGMYTYGDRAASPALAKLAVGSLLRATIRSNGRPLLLGIWERDGDQTVLVEAEEYPGQWTIGIPGTPKYWPGADRDIGALDTVVRIDPDDVVARLALHDAIAERS